MHVCVVLPSSCADFRSVVLVGGCSLFSLPDMEEWKISDLQLLMVFHVCFTGQEREQVQNRTSEVVNTRESIIETTPADPCGGVPTSQYNAGTTGTGTGITGSRGATTGAGYGTGTGSGVGTGSGMGSGASGQGTGAGGRTIT